MGKHAMLSGSSAARWTACPPSAVLNAEKAEQQSAYTQEGTDAHAVCQYLVEKQYGIPTRDPTEGLTYYSEEMRECAEDYLSAVNEAVSKVREEYGKPTVLVEQRVDFSRWVPGGYGTADCLILSDGIVHVIDYKHGAGVLVEVTDNVQMKCYALGAINTFGCLYDTDTVRMTVVQPRKDNIATWSISAEELLKWADEYLKPRALLASKGEGEFMAGPHCRFCKVRATCRKRAEENLELAREEFRPAPTLGDDEIADILGKIDGLTAWANDVKEYALSQALSGKRYEGFKLVQGRSVRKYLDEAAVADAVKSAGFDPFERKLLGVTAMTSLLGRKKFEDILGGLTVKPPGKPALVANSDKRPEYIPAAEDFKTKEEKT